MRLEAGFSIYSLLKHLRDTTHRLSVAREVLPPYRQCFGRRPRKMRFVHRTGTLVLPQANSRGIAAGQERDAD
jgi:hypothetical protein